MEDRSTVKKVVFETVQKANGDGSFTVSPRKVAVTREIGAGRAAEILGLHVKTVHELCKLGEANGGIEAYKLAKRRGNAKWRIDWESVMRYKSARREESRSAFD